MGAAGRLDQRFTFQTKTESVTSAGITSATWADSFTVWGDMVEEDARADESVTGGRVLSQTRMTGIVRYRSDITTAMRLLWRDRYFEITGKINRDGRREMLDLFLVERKSA